MENWIKAKWEDLRIGIKVKNYPSQEWTEKIRDIQDDKVYYSSDTLPNLRIYIKRNQLGKEFHELYIEQKTKGYEQLTLL